MSQHSTCVLYIDDDPALGRLVQRALGRLGYRVELANDIDSGTERLERGGIDVLVLDHYLPTGTGLDFLQSMQGRSDLPPVVYVTASAELSVAISALKAGAADYVPKSVGSEFIELLGRAINDALEKARLLRERERSEREIREAKERAEVLLGEVNHRVANSLAMVAALVRMQANSLSDATAKAALEETFSRISAIGGVHRRLYTSDDVRFVAIGEYLTSLVEELGMTMNASGHPSAIRLDVEPLALTTDKAVSLGVIVTELVTNAFKYAYPQESGGEVRVSFHRLGPANARLTVADDGVGFEQGAKPRGTGVGSRIIKAMAQNLGADLTYQAQNGTQAMLTFGL